MLSMYLKMLTTPRTVIPTEALLCPKDVYRVGKHLEEKVKKLFKGSLAIREVDAGSSNAEEQECNALTNAYYDIERFGISFVASPRHADMLLVTGPVTRNMEIPLRRTYEAVASPKFVVAVGDCAKTCGVFKDSYAVVGPVDRVIPVDITIAGCPPEPTDILQGILHGLDRLSAKGRLIAPSREPVATAR